ncbi:uncharacterized N-terminal domain of the transcription elongation factor GreA [Microbacterium testaceum StLB037]|uniref:Uncharacterized N-terminal domain of the transcription elongation factor GreA n=1 Tax=Microbacterium testaceum (strain StLB037) TaxID=979556 RepID=E8N8Y7_MICTS|nr:uncharacterized N-terminal domain of the transcription elongation factor GreA [Microbacterium testaceum StLB037]
MGPLLPSAIVLALSSRTREHSFIVQERTGGVQMSDKLKSDLEEAASRAVAEASAAESGMTIQTQWSSWTRSGVMPATSE